MFGFSLDDAKQWLVKSGTNLIMAILILLIGWWFAKWMGKFIKRIMSRGKVDEGLVTFLSSLAVIILKVLVFVTAITQLGVEMTSFVAILGAAGLAVGMAFSGTLSNFAGGVMILLFKPFKIGDTILTQTLTGKVKEIQIFYTYMVMPDNKMIVLPNGPIANLPLTNYTKLKQRRVEWLIPLENGGNFEQAKTLILQFLKEDKLVKHDTEPLVAINQLGESIQLIVRAWTSADHFSDVYFNLNLRVYEEFPKHKLILKEAK
jgi:small conductance mechanosensitive channel